MKKYFVVSDIHGFYDEFIRDLTKAGYDKENPNHILVVLGDIFDRGTQPLEVYNYLKSIPRERRILVRGNHEILLKDLIDRGYPESHDEHNRTIDTVYQLNGYKSYRQFMKGMYKEESEKDIKYGTPEYENFRLYWRNKQKEIFHADLIKEILDWIDSDEWQDYFETKDYIFVHSFIPVKEYLNIEKSLWCGFYVYDGPPDYREDWRNATEMEWNDAKWGCPWKQAKSGLNKTGKIIVCGHWHTSDIFNHLKNANNKHTYKQTYNPIVVSKRYKLIGIDACTALTREVNVFTFEEEETNE